MAEARRSVVSAMLSDSLKAPDRAGRSPRQAAPEAPTEPPQSETSAPPAANSSREVEAGDSAFAAVNYKRTTVFLTEELSTWMRQTVQSLGSETFRQSDVLRLALNRLKAEAADGLALQPLLADQLREEAKRSPGRFKRPIPTD